MQSPASGLASLLSEHELIGVRARGARGAAALPVAEMFEIFRAKRWWFGQKYSGENTLKGSQSQTLRLLSPIFALSADWN